MMKTYRIPHTDLDASRIGFGTGSLGGTWDKTPITSDLYERADQLLHAVVEHGINFIDMADVYTWGKSNQAVGYVIKQDPSFRDKVILQSKAGIMLPNEVQDGSPAFYNFSYDNIISRVETTLNSLNTDYLDILLLHRPDALVEPEEVARAFDELHSSGKVRYFGVSNHTPYQIELLKKYVDHPFVVNQVQLSLLHSDLITDGMEFNTRPRPYSGIHGLLDYCRANDILIQAWSPVAKGHIFSPPADASDTVRATADEIARLATHHNTTKEAIGLGWLLRHPAKIQPILGTLKAERVADSVKADDVQLSRLEWYSLLAIARGAGVP